MAVLTFDSGTGPGSGRTTPVFSNAGKPLRVVTGSVAFDNSYPTGGEDIASIFAKFGVVKAILFEHPLGSAGTGKLVVVDYTGKKALLHTMAAAEVVNASDQSGAAACRFVAWGYDGNDRTA